MSDNFRIDNTELVPVAIEDEMRKSYLDYAMSVIVSRAIPDARDGLKPVHRRILYSMYESSYFYNKPYKKSARIVGDVMGKYHPHGDQAIYDSLVRMAQSFSLRVPLIDGQGNFGSIDGDSPAAMRYTESRLAKVSQTLLEDLKKDTVDFRDNYDASETEPVVLPASFPNLLVNGSGGIAVGMATNIPTHNLGEVIDACCAYVDNEDITIDELIEIVPGPDFPTSATIINKSGIKSAYHTGRGSVIMRGKADIEREGKKESIVIHEIPYQVNKAKMIEKIAELVRDKRIEGISDIRDESNKDGIRVVIDTKRDATPEIVLNQLYTFTPLQTSFGINMLALNEGKPELMSLKVIIKCFVKFREEVITRRTNFLLNKAKDRTHILIGIAVAVANVDEVISLIKSSKDPNDAKEKLLSRDWNVGEIGAMIELVQDDSNKVIEGKFYLTETQAKAILEMRLQRLTGFEQERIHDELKELVKEIESLFEILHSREVMLKLLKEELLEVKENFATPRRTAIETSEYDHDIEDLIEREDMVVTVTHQGYIKRVPLATYKAQKRGGRGRTGLKMKDEDLTTEIFIANTHTNVMFFSNIGKVYKLKVYKLPLGNPQSKGRALVNILPLQESEKINNLMMIPDDESELENLNMVFATAKGNVRRNHYDDFKSIQSNGKIAMKLAEGDSLIGVSSCKAEDNILLAAKSGKCVRFSVEAVRVFKGRTSDGVRGIRLEKNDELISMSVLNGTEISMETREEYLKIPVEERIKLANEETKLEALQKIETTLKEQDIIDLAVNEEFILTITENGFAKRSSAYEYRVTNRGGKGIVNMVTNKKNGQVIASLPAIDGEHIIIITNQGIILRSCVSDIRIQGRNTQGVILQRTSDEEKVVSVAKIAISHEELEEEYDD